MSTEPKYGGTNFEKAILEIKNLVGADQKIKSIVLFLSDGEDYGNFNNLIKE